MHLSSEVTEVNLTLLRELRVSRTSVLEKGNCHYTRILCYSCLLFLYFDALTYWSLADSEEDCASQGWLIPRDSKQLCLLYANQLI